jgi:hypothetical protein
MVPSPPSTTSGSREPARPAASRSASPGSLTACTGSLPKRGRSAASAAGRAPHAAEPLYAMQAPGN